MTGDVPDPGARPDTAADAEAEAAEALAGRLMEGLLACMEYATVHLGVRLGLYETLDEHGPLSAEELARLASVHPRYAREWLEQQAVAGILAVAQDPPGPEHDPYERRFLLPAPHRAVLVDRRDPLHLSGAPLVVAGLGEALPQLLAAFTTGEGVPYAAYGGNVREGIARLNRPMYHHELAATWLRALPDVHARLGEPGAAVLDLGCGMGWSSIAMARAFPGAKVTGVDLDASSVEAARRNAADAGLGPDRLAFVHGDAASAGAGGQDLVTVFEALHDMADPVGVLTGVRGTLRPHGAVLVADERVEEEFTAPGTDLERLNYAFSVTHCLPATRAEGTEVEAGTVLRPAVLRAYAHAAGFRDVRVADVEHEMWRFYRLDP